MHDPPAGWRIDPSTLRPVITDEHEFRAQHSSDPALEVLVALWSGEPHAAMVALSTLLETDADHWRWRALRADIRRDLGEHDHAIAEYEELLDDHAGTDREAVLIQHLGKAHFAAGHYDAAASCFERALRLRSASAGADPCLVASSRIALDEARRRAAIPAITFTEFDPATDVEPLVAFLAANAFPFHSRPRTTEGQAREVVLGGRYWSADALGLWVDADGERIGIAVIDDLGDVATVGNPLFDLRFAETHRGRGLGVPVLRGLTDLVFSRWPGITRFEGHTREDNLAMRATFRGAGWVKEAYHRAAWPVDGAAPKSSVAYSALRRDWEAGTTTPIVWDDL